MTKTFSKKLAAATAAIAFTATAYSGAADAATATDTLAVTATVVDTCSITAADIAFGNYDPLSLTATDGTASLTVSCTLAAAYTVELDAGTGTLATTASRFMEDASSNQLQYSIYQDAAHLLVCGTVADTDNVSGVGTGLPVATTMFGQIVANQQVPAGSYSDTVTATINF